MYSIQFHFVKSVLSSCNLQSKIVISQPARGEGLKCILQLLIRRVLHDKYQACKKVARTRRNRKCFFSIAQHFAIKKQGNWGYKVPPPCTRYRKREGFLSTYRKREGFLSTDFLSKVKMNTIFSHQG